VPQVPPRSDSKLLLADDFASLDESVWGPAGEQLSVQDGEMVLKPQANTNLRVLERTVSSADVDVTAKVRVGNAGLAAAGICFWGVDPTNHHVFVLYGDGELALVHWLKERFVTPLPKQAIASAKIDPQGWNELRVVAQHGLVTLFANGAEVFSFRGNRPHGGGYVGLYAERAGEPMAAHFRALRVTLPQAAAPPDDPNLILADHFSSLSRGWGPLGKQYSVADNSLRIQLAKQNEHWLIPSQFVDDTDVSARVKFADKHDGSAGILFWQNDNTDRFLFLMAPSGQLSVKRLVGGRNLDAVPWREMKGTRIDPLSWNEMRVVTQGSRAVCSVNGKEFATVIGQPSPDGTLFGLYASNGNEGVNTASFSELRAVRLAAPSTKPESRELLVDNFSKLQPMWETTPEESTVADNSLTLKTKKAEATHVLCQALVFANMDARIKVRLPGAGGKGVGRVGFQFWTKSYGDFYEMTVLGELGVVAVSRFTQNKYELLMNSVTVPDAKIDPTAWTELRVVTVGKTATVYANNVKIGSIEGEPPPTGLQIGLLGAAGPDADGTAHFSDLRIVLP
jgi:hypothetical protein